jgi:DNA-binding winged helix-turn-helix (wHTH) protein
VLAVLVEHAGNVVTREELHSKLWLSDTFVDFDHGLNNAIARIREVLDDSSETPRYVETIPRRGYRFIAPVADVRQVTVSASSAEATVSPASKIARPDAPPTSVVTAAKRFPSRHLHVLVGGVAVLSVAALLFELYRGRSAKGWRGPAVKSLAVLPLNNLSGDPEQEYFADGMTEALIAELGKISAPRVISRQSIMQYKGSKKGCPRLPENSTWMQSWRAVSNALGIGSACSSTWTRFRRRVNSGPTNTTATSATCCGYRMRLRVRSRMKSKSN